MTHRTSTVALIVTITGLLALAPAGITAAQSAPSASPRPAARPYAPPKTPWGEPDLQGLYSNKTITPGQSVSLFE